MTTDLPTRSIVTSLRAHSPLSKSSLPVSSRTTLPLPVGFFLHPRNIRPPGEGQEKGGGIPGRLDPPLLPDVEHGELDGLHTRIGLAGDGGVVDAQKHNAPWPSIGPLAARVASKGGGGTWKRPAPHQQSAKRAGQYNDMKTHQSWAMAAGDD